MDLLSATLGGMKQDTIVFTIKFFILASFKLTDHEYRSLRATQWLRYKR